MAGLFANSRGDAASSPQGAPRIAETPGACRMAASPGKAAARSPPENFKTIKRGGNTRQISLDFSPQVAPDPSDNHSNGDEKSKPRSGRRLPIGSQGNAPRTNG